MPPRPGVAGKWCPQPCATRNLWLPPRHGGAPCAPVCLYPEALSLCFPPETSEGALRVGRVLAMLALHYYISLLGCNKEV